MTNETSTRLATLGDENVPLGDGADDVYGRAVVDRTSGEMGDAAVLMRDEGEERSRFLHMVAVGFLGFDEWQFLIPVDAVIKVDHQRVHIDQDCTRMMDAPAHDSNRVQQPDYDGRLSGQRQLPLVLGAGLRLRAVPELRPRSVLERGRGEGTGNGGRVAVWKGPDDARHDGKTGGTLATSMTTTVVPRHGNGATLTGTLARGEAAGGATSRRTPTSLQMTAVVSATAHRGAGPARRGPMLSWNRLRRALVPVVLVIALAGCGDEEEVATDREAIPNVSPTALAAWPDAIEEATVRVEGGAFGVEDLVLYEDEPTVLHIVNTDDRAYRLTITEDLVWATPIAASATTDLQLTTPDANVYEGQLLAAERDDTLDTLRVIVQAAGGVEP